MRKLDGKLCRRYKGEQRQQAILHRLVGLAVLGAGTEAGERSQVIARAVTFVLARPYCGNTPSSLVRCSSRATLARIDAAAMETERASP